jgi:SynChlorMet cassette radical SAM/SPASM protein ScmF
MIKPETYALRSLYIYLTDSCNLNCRHCWIKPSQSDSAPENNISPRSIEKAIKEALPLGLSRVKLTGGEPLLRKDALEIIEIVGKAGLILDIETNGTLITAETAGVLSRTRKGTVSISLDSPQPQEHDLFRGVEGAFERAVRGMGFLREREVPFQVICSAYRDNCDDIGDLIKKASSLGASSFKINPVTPHGRALEMFSGGSNLSVKEILELKRKVDELYAPVSDIPVHMAIPLAFYGFEQIKACEYGLCHILNILGILADGRISFCGIGQTEEDLVMGDIKKESIADIWKNSPILKRMREDIPEKLSGICGKCIFRKVCLGTCVAATYSMTGTFTEGYWFCEKAYEQGLFPETRLIDNA